MKIKREVSSERLVDREKKYEKEKEGNRGRSCGETKVKEKDKEG